MGREEDEVLLALDLHVDVLVVVFVEGSYGARITNPNRAMEVRLDFGEYLDFKGM